MLGCTALSSIVNDNESISSERSSETNIYLIPILLVSIAIHLSMVHRFLYLVYYFLSQLHFLKTPSLVKTYKLSTTQNMSSSA